VASRAAAEVILTTGRPTVALSTLSARSIALAAAQHQSWLVHAPCLAAASSSRHGDQYGSAAAAAGLVFVAAVLASLVAHAASLVAMQLSIQLLFAALSLRLHI
jgi:hypothetical protein